MAALAVGDGIVVRYSIRAATPQDAAGIENKLELPSTMVQLQTATAATMPNVAVVGVTTERVSDAECPSEAAFAEANAAVTMAILAGFLAIPCCCGACIALVCRRICCHKPASTRGSMYSSQVGSVSAMTANPHSEAVQGKPVGMLVTKTV